MVVAGVFISAVKSTVPSYQIDVSSTSIHHLGLDSCRKTGTVLGSFYGPPHSPDMLLDDLLLSIATMPK